MTHSLIIALKALTEHLISLSAEDVTLRDPLREIGHQLVTANSITQKPLTGQSEMTIDEWLDNEADMEQLKTFVGYAHREEKETPSRKETVLKETVVVKEPPKEIQKPKSSTNTLPQYVSEQELPEIEWRCRLKAEACRWIVEKRRMIETGLQNQVTEKEFYLIERAKAVPDCYLWMLRTTANNEPLEQLAINFDAAAEILQFAYYIIHNRPNELGTVLQLLAETQSSLFSAVQKVTKVLDRDQYRLYVWLKRETVEQQLYIHRYMRLDDVADPANSADLYERIVILKQQIKETDRMGKERMKLLKKIRHKRKLLRDDPKETATHWRIIIETVDKLIELGSQPSSIELRDEILPIVEEIPSDLELSPPFLLVLREIDRYLANRPSSVVQEQVEPLSAETQEVARLMKGQSMVMIGGDKRLNAYNSLKEAFNLEELYWLDTKETHQSVEDFEPYICRPDVAIVLLAIRWSRHRYGDVKMYCDIHQKALVRLPSGYGINQVANQILDQASERLRSEEGILP